MSEAHPRYNQQPQQSQQLKPQGRSAAGVAAGPAVDKCICPYCDCRFTFGEKLWNHVNKDHSSQIQRHPARDTEALKRDVIDAGIGKARRARRRSRSPAGRRKSHISTETAPTGTLGIGHLQLSDATPRYRALHSPWRRSDVPRVEPRRATKKHEKRREVLLDPTDGHDLLHLTQPPSRELSDSQMSRSPPPESSNEGLLKQPPSKEISKEQLSQEVKSIYAGLMMVESKCIHVCDTQASLLRRQEQAANPHWQALIALHKTLLHEHHDFFLASQHPAADPALKHLASKCSMPARMWKHGIFSFLELLRHRLPETMDHLLSFLYLAYQMVALLYETVPAFEDTWIECLGDLARYRMAIDENPRDREIWLGVARHWYTKAASKNPSIGRLFHHLAILARPRLVEQLYFYCRSLTCVQAFLSSRESARSLLDPSYTSQVHLASSDSELIKAHSVLFDKGSLATFDSTVDSLLGHLDRQIGRVTIKWKEQGAYIALTNISSLFDYGSPNSFLRQLFLTYSATEHQEPLELLQSAEPPTPEDTLVPACKLLFSTFRLVLQRVGDRNVLLHINLVFSFLVCLASLPCDTRDVFRHVPWGDVIRYLNHLAQTQRLGVHVEDEQFPALDQEDRRPLPEDFLAQGQIWCAENYFPDGWFEQCAHFDEEERTLELASTTKIRRERIAWLGIRLAAKCPLIRYDVHSKQWSDPTHSMKWRSPKAVEQPLVSASDHDVLMTDAPAEPLEAGYSPGPLSDIEAVKQGEGAYEHAESELGMNRSPTRSMSSPTSPGESPSRVKGPMLSHVKAIVCDVNMLSTQPEVFTSLVEAGEWNVIVPHSVVTELLVVSKQRNNLGSTAMRGLTGLKNAIDEGKNVRILTGKGEVITLDHIAGHEMGDQEGLDGTTIGVARRASNIHGASPLVSVEGDVTEALLITENQTLSKRAWESGVTTMATSIFKKLLRHRSRAGSATSGSGASLEAQAGG